MTLRAFRRYLGIHYAGAETPDSGLKSLRVYSATPDALPQEVLPPPGRFDGRAEGCLRHCDVIGEGPLYSGTNTW